MENIALSFSQELVSQAPFDRSTNKIEGYQF